MGFLPEPLLYIILLGIMAALLLCCIYYIIILSDLECDYLNAQECCSKLNFYVTPRLVTFSFMVFILLIHGCWNLVVLTSPMLAWLVYELSNVPKGNMGIYDPTEIHNMGLLKRHIRNCMISIGCYLLYFFVALYCLIVSLLKGDPINRKDEGEIMDNFNF